MLRFKEIYSESKPIFELAQKQEDLAGFYLYFIVFRSPVSPNKWNYYVGIKHSSGVSAKDFFAGLRYNPNGKSFFEAGETKFDDALLKWEPNREREWNLTTHYMSSAKLETSESLVTAYKKGIINGETQYHPLMCTNYMLNNLTKGKRETFLDRLKNVVLRLFKKKEEQETVFFPRELAKEGEDSAPFIQRALSDDFSYQPYVLDDMRMYLETLDKIIENMKGKNFSGKEHLQSVKDRQNNPENLMQDYLDQAIDITQRFYKDIKSALPNFMGGNKNQYVNWLVKQFDPKTSDPEVCAKKLQIGGYESISMKPEGEDGEELVQKQNQSGGGSTLKNKEKIFRLCYLPSSMSDEDKKKASDACRSWFQNSAEDKDERKQKKFENARQFDEISDMKDLKKLQSEFEQVLQGKGIRSLSPWLEANLSFTTTNQSMKPDSMTERQNGFSDVYDGRKFISTLIFNFKDGLLQKLVKDGDQNARKELKERFEKFELPIAARKHKEKRLDELSILISDKRKHTSFFVYKTAKNELKLVENSFDKEGYSNARPYKDAIYTMYDFIIDLGYKPLDKVGIRELNQSRQNKNKKEAKVSRDERVYEFAERLKIKLYNKLEKNQEEVERSNSSMISELNLNSGSTTSVSPSVIALALKNSKKQDDDSTSYMRKAMSGLGKNWGKPKKFQGNPKADTDKKVETETDKSKSLSKGVQKETTNKIAANLVYNLFTPNAKKINAFFFENEKGQVMQSSLEHIQSVLLLPVKEKLESIQTESADIRSFGQFLKEDTE